MRNSLIVVEVLVSGSIVVRQLIGCSNIAFLSILRSVFSGSFFQYSK